MDSLWGQMNSNANNMYLLVLLGGVLSRILPDFFGLLREYASSYIFTNVEILDSEEAFDWIMNYVVESGLLKSNNLQLNVKDVDSDESSGSRRFSKKNKLTYYPGPGEHILWFKSQPIFMNFDRTMSPYGGGHGHTDKICLRSYRKAIIEDLISTAVHVQHEKDKGKTTMYMFSDNSYRWKVSVSKKRKPLESVVLDAGLVKKLISDVEEFIASKDWYFNLGIPHHRTYLLYGKPGCGKTSFVAALAGHLGLNLCLMNLSAKGFTDRDLTYALTKAPPNSIILLEDVDAAFQSRTLEPESKPETLNPNEPPKKSTELTFSGFLNAIDGVGSPEGKIFIMTTNHLEKLDPALVRPGRVDKKIEFKLANRKQIENLFIKFYGEQEKDLAQKFALRIDEETVSMATLQEHFVCHKNSPLEAFNNWEVDNWSKSVADNIPSLASSGEHSIHLN